MQCARCNQRWHFHGVNYNVQQNISLRYMSVPIRSTTRLVWLFPCCSPITQPQPDASLAQIPAVRYTFISLHTQRFVHSQADAQIDQSNAFECSWTPKRKGVGCSVCGSQAPLRKALNGALPLREGGNLPTGSKLLVSLMATSDSKGYRDTASES